jgi:hypothetical protein
VIDDDPQGLGRYRALLEPDGFVAADTAGSARLRPLCEPGEAVA